MECCSMRQRVHDGYGNFLIVTGWQAGVVLNANLPKENMSI
jgi:hypothetical protein